MGVMQFANHTSNSTESRFSNQVKMTSSNLMAQGQGAILKNHDWIFMSTFGNSIRQSSNKNALNNVSRDIVARFAEESSCILPQDPGSTYYKAYGFKLDDNR